MEKIELTKSTECKKNQKISDNTFKLFSGDKAYELTFNKLTDEIEFTLSTENNFENFNKKFNFIEIQKSPCFKLEENLDELNSALIHYVLENKIKVFEKDNFSVLVFESEFNGKKLKSEIILNSNILSEAELIKNLKTKVNFLISENSKKDEKIEILVKENKEISEKINDLCKELVKIKDFINENKNLNKNNSELIENVKKVKKPGKKAITADSVTTSSKKKITVNALIPKSITDPNYLELKRLKFPLIKNYESQILSNAENEKLLFNEWLGKEFTMDLLYSSDLHGQDVSIFHERCDGESETLTLIQTNKGRRFGGFTYLKFSSENKFENGNGEDFIFTLDKKMMFKNDKNHIYALYNNPNMFPTFGYPSDIYVHKTCFTSSSSYCSFPSSYGVEAVLSEPRQDYFAGSHDFTVSMIEVFKINFD